MGVHPKVFPDCMHTSVSNLVQHGKFHWEESAKKRKRVPNLSTRNKLLDRSRTFSFFHFESNSKPAWGCWMLLINRTGRGAKNQNQKNVRRFFLCRILTHPTSLWFSSRKKSILLGRGSIVLHSIHTAFFNNIFSSAKRSEKGERSKKKTFFLRTLWNERLGFW